MSNPTNSAAWLTGKSVKPLKVLDAPYTKPGPDQLVVRNRAVAINPVDYIKQDIGDFIYEWVKYPFVLGSDLAGEVVEVGSAVTRFKPGDRVLALAVGADKRVNKSSESAFQLYSVVREHCTTELPPSVSFEAASTLPLGMATAAAGLFAKDTLGLRYPTVPPRPVMETLVIWGASTSLGCNAIQMAVAAGYEVYATAGKRNHDLVTSLGATEVFDYKSPTVVADLVAALTAAKGKKCAGALAMGNFSTENCVDVLAKVPGARKFVSQASKTMQEGPMSAGAVVYFLQKSASLWLKGTRKGVDYKFLWGLEPAFDAVGPAIWRDYLPKALANGSFKPAPEANVVGQGLDKIQGAFDTLKAGVSAKKIVVLL